MPQAKRKLNMKDKPCPFCDFNKLRNESFFVHWEPFPVGIGHVKIMPFRHKTDIFNLTTEEATDLADIIKRTKKYLDVAMGEHKPDGYNIGINCGEAAGQTIAHLHIHVIPRYKGDVENPRGGVRNIKPPLVSW